NYAEWAGIKFNHAVFLAWGISFALYYLISTQLGVFLSFLTLPAWITCGILFIIISKNAQKSLRFR
ncbi:MAG: hypothetical protein KDC53_21735, partial [Saprospiraceae bacterium]|nr:hypothetical protein [Saprospiraceae bacterium]